MGVSSSASFRLVVRDGGIRMKIGRGKTTWARPCHARASCQPPLKNGAILITTVHWFLGSACNKTERFKNALICALLGGFTSPYNQPVVAAEIRSEVIVHRAIRLDRLRLPDMLHGRT